MAKNFSESEVSDLKSGRYRPTGHTMFAGVVKSRARHGSPRARDRGAVLVEAALVLPILIMTTFGIIEYGMAFGNAATTASASRSGSRLASTGYAGSGDKPAYLTSVSLAVKSDLGAMSRGEAQEMWVYQANSGLPGTCSSRCIKWTWNTSTNTWNNPTGSWTDPDACGDTIDYVGVWVKTRHPFITGLFGTEKIITQRTTMRLEPLPADQC